MAADLAVEEGQAPEADQRQVVGVDRPAHHLGDEVVGRGQAQGREPQAQRVVAVPPVHRRLLHAHVQPRDVGHREQHREPQQPGRQVPDRDVEVVHLALQQRQRQRHAHQAAAHEEQDVHRPGEFQPLHAVRPAGQQRRHTQRDAGMPQARAPQRVAGPDQPRLQQARDQPQRDAHAREGTPAVADDVQVRRPDAAEGQPGLRGQPVRQMQLQRGQQAEDRTPHQPHQGQRQADQGRGGAGAVGIEADGQLLGIDRGGRGAHRVLQAALALGVEGGVLDMAALTGREDGAGAGFAGTEEAARHRPDEDHQRGQGDQEGQQKEDDGLIHQGVLRVSGVSKRMARQGQGRNGPDAGIRPGRAGQGAPGSLREPGRSAQRPGGPRPGGCQRRRRACVRTGTGRGAACRAARAGGSGASASSSGRRWKSLQ